MSEAPQSIEAVAYELMKDLLRADGKALVASDNRNAAKRNEIAAAYHDAIRLARGAAL